MIFSLSFTARKAADLSHLLCERKAWRRQISLVVGWFTWEIGLGHVGEAGRWGASSTSIGAFGMDGVVEDDGNRGASSGDVRIINLS